MPADFARSRTLFTVAILAVTMQPVAARHRVHSHHHTGRVVASRAAATIPSAHHVTPGYNDPSKVGGNSATAPEGSSAAEVHVQPRGGGFAPNSDDEKMVQRQLTDFNEVQRQEDESFDRRLNICRGC